MPVLSPHRNTSSGGYRSSFGSTLERPYYTPSYPRISSYSERFTSRSYTDGDGRRVYTRSGSITEDGVTTRFREETREGSASRRDSLCRRDSAQSDTAALDYRPPRDSSLCRAGDRPSASSVLDSVAELRNKYSPANYVPACLRKNADSVSRSRSIGDIGLPPLDSGRSSSARKKVNTDGLNCNNSTGVTANHTNNVYDEEEDDNGNRTSVADLRKRFDERTSVKQLSKSPSPPIDTPKVADNIFKKQDIDSGGSGRKGSKIEVKSGRTAVKTDAKLLNGESKAKKTPSRSDRTVKTESKLEPAKNNLKKGQENGRSSLKASPNEPSIDKLHSCSSSSLNDKSSNEKYGDSSKILNGRDKTIKDLEKAVNGKERTDYDKESVLNDMRKLQVSNERLKEKSGNDRDKLNGERDRTSSERDKISNERDKASSEKDKIISEKDRVSSERERNQLTNEKDKTIGEKSKVTNDSGKISSHKDKPNSTKTVNDVDKTVTERDRKSSRDNVVRDKPAVDKDKMTVKNKLTNDRSKTAVDKDKQSNERSVETRRLSVNGEKLVNGHDVVHEGDSAKAYGDVDEVDSKRRLDKVEDSDGDAVAHKISRVNDYASFYPVKGCHKGEEVTVNGGLSCVGGATDLDKEMEVNWIVDAWRSGHGREAASGVSGADGRVLAGAALPFVVVVTTAGALAMLELLLVPLWAVLLAAALCGFLSGLERGRTGGGPVTSLRGPRAVLYGGARAVDGRRPSGEDMGASPKLTRSTVSPSGSGVSGSGLAVGGSGGPSATAAARRSLEREQRERRNSYGKEEPSPPPSTLYDKLDRERSITNNHQERIYDKLYDRSSPVKTLGLNGLKNIGNTCFMNSVIQCLSNTRLLNEYLRKDAYVKDINTTISGMKGALIRAFAEVIKELWGEEASDRVVNTVSLKSQIQRFAPRFMGYAQQDAQEFLRYLLEGLHEDVNRVTEKPKPILTEIDEKLSDSEKSKESWQRYLRMDNSRIVDIFVGQLKSTLRCTHCGHASVTFDPFWDLSLPIPQRTGQLRLSQCLDSFTREETLDGDEKPTCSKCKERRKCTKSFTIQKFPKILVIHLKRFSPTERFRGKLNVTVDFPLEGLDMGNYGAEGAGPARYSLYAVSNHSGTTYSGHYTAYCRHPYAHTWHEYNDSRVSSQSSKSVVSSEAYVLFYELDGQKSHL